MHRSHLRRRDAGFTFIDVSAGLVILVIGVLGYAGTIIYTRNLDRNTRQLSRSSAAAVSALEDVRQDAAGKWASLDSLWDGHTLVAAGAANAVDGALQTTVSDDPTLLDSGDGMWKPGSIEPNYYHVSVTAASTQNGMANALNYQTYVADRTGFSSLAADPYAGPPVVGTEADSIDPVPRNVGVSGFLNNQLTFQLMNASPKPVKLKSLEVKVSVKGKSGFTNCQVDGTTLYDQPLKPVRHLELKPNNFNQQLMVNPGAFQVSIRGAPLPGGTLAALIGKKIELKLRFSDGSKVELVVKP